MKKQGEIEMKRQQLIAIGIGCVCFGAVMVLRDIMPNIWLRMLVAATAFAILGLTIQRVQRIRAQKSNQ